MELHSKIPTMKTLEFIFFMLSSFLSRQFSQEKNSNNMPIGNRQTISTFNFRFIPRNNFSKISLQTEILRAGNIRMSFQIVCFTNNQHDHRHNHYHHLEDIFPRTRHRGTSDERKREIAKRAERRRRVAGAISRECRHACRIAERGDQGKRTLEDWATRTN